VKPHPARPTDGIAWVTGASAGIGLHVVQRLLKDGWRVAATARRREPLERVAAAHPGRVVVLPADVTDEAAVRAALASLDAPVALAILNAGTYVPMGAADFSLSAWREQIELNLNGTANCLAAVMPVMIARQSGQIALVASVAGYRGLPTSLAYGATKAALINLAEALKFDLDRAGVMMNLINPGFVRTPLTDRNTFDMPFLMEPDAAADRIVRGLARDGFEVTFPRRFTFMLKALRLLPYALYFPLVARGTKQR
jgi:NAD(P)-dependent dehydrogenase (short-subunit alcohol dehydrogenase family)